MIGYRGYIGTSYKFKAIQRGCEGCQRTLSAGLNERLYSDNAGARMGYTSTSPSFETRPNLLLDRPQEKKGDFGQSGLVGPFIIS